MDLLNLASYGINSYGNMDSGSFLAVFAGMMLVFVIIAIAFYIFMALALMFTAKKLNMENAWLAWIPIGNLYLMAKMAGMHWWPILLIVGTFIPFVGFLFGIALMVFVTIWTWKICEARGKPGWWAIIALIPIANFIIWGMLAWGQ